MMDICFAEDIKHQHSIAIDHARLLKGLNRDQRGVARPQDGDGVPIPDIGAYEFKTTIVIPSVGTPPPGLVGIFFTPDQNPNCRSGPGTIYLAIGIASKGQNFAIMGAQYGFQLVRDPSLKKPALLGSGRQRDPHG